MLSSAATFGFFLSIGSVCEFSCPHRKRHSLLVFLQVIRNDTPPHWEATRLQLTSPIVHSRNEGLAIMKARWELEKARHRS